MVKSNLHKVLFAGGGTAGHLMPAINIALEMTRMDRGILPLFVGKKGGMEAGIVAKFDFDIREIDVVGLRRNPAGLVRFLLKWNRSIKQASAIIKEFAPSAIVGSGGYVSAPVVRAGHRSAIPVFLQEQNSLPGLATRTLSRMASVIFIAYEGASRYLPAEKCRFVGNPLRPDLLDADRGSALKEFDLDPDKKTLLVLGGSSGASGINRAVLSVIVSGAIPTDWQILWQMGQKDLREMAPSIPLERFRGNRLAFIHNMPGAYAIADLVLSRAGAMALSEIAACGLPSVLIPYPYAAGDHQSLNARRFEETGAAIVIRESDIVARLEGALLGLMSDSSKREALSRAAGKLSKPEAARIIAKTIVEKIDEIQKN